MTSIGSYDLYWVVGPRWRFLPSFFLLFWARERHEVAIDRSSIVDRLLLMVVVVVIFAGPRNL